MTTIAGRRLLPEKKRAMERNVASVSPSRSFSHGKNPDMVTVPTAGVLIADARKVVDGQVSQDFMAAIALHRHWNRLNLDAIPA